jgi:hypothetical protein
MVTPVAKHPIASRNSAGLRLMSYLDFGCFDCLT